MGSTFIRTSLPGADVFHLDDIPEPPPAPAFTPGTEKFARIGPIAVACAGWGTPLDNERIIGYFVRQDWDEALVRADVLRTGFKLGNYFPSSNHLLSEETQGGHAHWAAALAERVMDARGWRHIDVLVIASTSTTNQVPGRAADILRQHGYRIDQAKLYAQACNSALAAINDMCRTPEQHGIRAVVVGMESLTGSMGDYANPISLRTFGNGGGAIAFIPGHEIQHINGRTQAEYDLMGVISGPRPFRMPTPAEQIPLPPWYEITGEQTAGKCLASDLGIFMEPPYNPDEILLMQGKATLMYFAKRVPPFANDVVQTYLAHYRDEYGPLGLPFSHQPSLPVLIFINHELLRLGMESLGIEKKDARKLSKLEDEAERNAALADMGITDFVPVQIPWVMGDSGFNNISAGTSMVALVEMIERDLIHPYVPTPVFGFGVGSVIQADIWRFTVDD